MAVSLALVIVVCNLVIVAMNHAMMTEDVARQDARFEADMAKWRK